MFKMPSETKRRDKGKTGKIHIKSGVESVVMCQGWFLNFGKRTTVIKKNVNIRSRGRVCGSSLYYFCNFSGNLMTIPKQKVYFKMNRWEDASRDGMGDQEDRTEIGGEAGPMTRPGREDWVERKSICRLDSGKFKTISKWHLLSVSERKCYH